MDGFVLEEKISFKLNWDSYTVSIVKIVSKIVSGGSEWEVFIWDLMTRLPSSMVFCESHPYSEYQNNYCNLFVGSYWNYYFSSLLLLLLLFTFCKITLYFLRPTLFSLYINDISDNICNMVIYDDNTTRYSMCLQTSDL